MRLGFCRIPQGVEKGEEQLLFLALHESGRKRGCLYYRGVSSAFDRLSCIRKGRKRCERYLAA